MYKKKMVVHPFTCVTLCFLLINYLKVLMISELILNWNRPHDIIIKNISESEDFVRQVPGTDTMEHFPAMNVIVLNLFSLLKSL